MHLPLIGLLTVYRCFYRLVSKNSLITLCLCGTHHASYFHVIDWVGPHVLLPEIRPRNELQRKVRIRDISLLTSPISTSLKSSRSNLFRCPNKPLVWLQNVPSKFATQ